MEDEPNSEGSGQKDREGKREVSLGRRKRRGEKYHNTLWKTEKRGGRDRKMGIQIE